MDRRLYTLCESGDNDDDEYMDYAVDLATISREILDLKAQLRDKLDSDIAKELIDGQVAPLNRDRNTFDVYSDKYAKLMAQMNRARKRYLDSYRPSNAPSVASLLKGHLPD